MTKQSREERLAYLRDYRKKNRARITRQERNRKSRRISRAAWQKRNQVKISARTKAWQKANPEQFKSHQLRYRYGISFEEFSRIKAAQRGKCAICRQAEATDLDHNHKTGAVRGILCSPCNKGLGFFKDNRKVLAKAIKYLEKSNGG